ncbi:MAG: N-acetyl-gamma-glutamyl-phosphate reductase [Cellulosilyticaceae bacterium]
MKKVAILGATGYVGEELVRLLYNHPEIDIGFLSSHSYVGKDYSEVYPQFLNLVDHTCIEDDLGKIEADILFIALPHGIASKVVNSKLVKQTKVIDLGADFRISLGAYDKWYKTTHYGKEVWEEAVYGLCEWNREEIKEANLIANPGCYVTCSLLSLLPLVKEKLIHTHSIIIDAKSGVSGAGRGLDLGTHFTECNESIKAYGLTTHRHTPEIEEHLENIGEEEVCISFTPHLIPMNRGILTTIYASLKAGITREAIEAAYHKYYQEEKFVRLLAEGKIAETRWVKGSNYCDISFKIDERSNRVIIVSSIDNLVKGAAGQAVQNMNIMMGWEEHLGINMPPIFPA